MKETFIINLTGRKLLIAGALWVLLWAVPWPQWLDALPWLRLVVAILVFVMPGFVISSLLVGARLGVEAHFTIGLGISVFIVSSLGFLGRVLHLPFDTIRFVFVLIGLTGLVFLYRHSRSEPGMFRLARPSAVVLVSFLLMVALGTLVNLQKSRLGGDDYSYLAYLTSWQHAQPLNFQEVVFASGGLDALRFWVAMFPMNLAFLSQISGIPGILLLGLYLEPLLIAIALLAAYNWYKRMLLSTHLALAALLLQFAFLFMLQGDQQPGITFFIRLSEDKAFTAFVLAPVFFLVLHLALESLTIRTGLLLLLIGLGISLVHPVILAFCLFIGGVWVGIATLLQKDYRKLVLMVLLMGATLLPSVPLRFVDIPSAPNSFDLESAMTGHPNIVDTRISFIENTPFYGFKPQRVQIVVNEAEPDEPLEVFFSWSFLWVLALGFIWSLIHMNTSSLAPFMMAASLLVLLCLIPYTGWLVGYFVTARMLWRTPWMLPAGLFGLVLLGDLVRMLMKKPTIEGSRRFSSEHVSPGLASLLSIVLIVSFFISNLSTLREEIKTLPPYIGGLEEYARLGDYLEQNINEPSRFAANIELMNNLPGISSKSKVVLFRNERYSRGYYGWVARMDDIQLILSTDQSIPLGDRIKNLKKTQARYILVSKPAAMRYYSEYPESFRIQPFERFWIIEYLKYRQ